MTLNIYLFFDGQCADAFDFYKSVFGGAFTRRSTYAEAPPSTDGGKSIAPDEMGRIMHVSLPVGASVLMGSDATRAHGGGTFRTADNFAISYSASTRADADAKFAALSAGGAASMPMTDMFWGAYFGMCRDRFGVEWMVNCEC